MNYDDVFYYIKIGPSDEFRAVYYKLVAFDTELSVSTNYIRIPIHTIRAAIKGALKECPEDNNPIFDKILKGD